MRVMGAGGARRSRSSSRPGRWARCSTSGWARHLTEARWLVLLLGAVARRPDQLDRLRQHPDRLPPLGLAQRHPGGHERAGRSWGWWRALLLGQGLIGLAVANVAGRGARPQRAHLHAPTGSCPWLEIKRRHFRPRDRARDAEVRRQVLPDLHQPAAHELVRQPADRRHLGPAALALYQRPVALVRNLSVVRATSTRWSSRPTISSFQGAGRHGGASVTWRSRRPGTASYLSLPVLLLLVVFGGEVLRVWMGDRYADRWLVAVVVCGFEPDLLHPALRRPGRPEPARTYGFANLRGAATALPAATWRSPCFHGGPRRRSRGGGADVDRQRCALPAAGVPSQKTPIGVFWREVWWRPSCARSPTRPASLWGASSSPERRSGEWSGEAASAW